MKFKFLALLSLLFLVVNTKAQNQQPVKTASVSGDVASSYLGVSIGAAVPMFKYRDSAFVTRGLSIAIDGGFLLFKTKQTGFGFALKADYGSNPVDVSGLTTQMNTTFYQETLDPNITGSVTHVGNFTYEAAYGGIYITVPSGKFSTDLKLLAGYMYAGMPDININVYYNGSLVGISEQSAAYAGKLSASLGIGLRYTPVPVLSIMLTGDFLYSRPAFTVTGVAVAQNSNGGVQVGNFTGTGSQYYEVVNISLGLAWTFGYKALGN